MQTLSHYVALLLTIFLLPHSHLFQSCSYSSSNQEPSTGSCSGPIQRVLLRQTNLISSNSGCSNGQILYYEDGDTNMPRCGNCVPGTAGATDSRKMCDINQYCTDNATCADIRSHPLYNAVCPYHLEDDVGGFCGPGLTCFQHVCLPCIDGMYDTSDGKMCIMNMWTYNKWNMLIYDPQASLLAILCGIIVILGIISVFVEFILCCVKKIARDKKITFLRAMKDEVTRALKWAKGDDEGWEEQVLQHKVKSNNKPLPSKLSELSSKNVLSQEITSNYIPLISTTPKKPIHATEIEMEEQSSAVSTPQNFYASRINLISNKSTEEEENREEQIFSTPKKAPSRRADSFVNPPSAAKRLPMHAYSNSTSTSPNVETSSSGTGRRLPALPPRALRKSFDEEPDEY